MFLAWYCSAIPLHVRFSINSFSGCRPSYINRWLVDQLILRVLQRMSCLLGNCIAGFFSFAGVAINMRRVAVVSSVVLFYLLILSYS